MLVFLSHSQYKETASLIIDFMKLSHDMQCFKHRLALLVYFGFLPLAQSKYMRCRLKVIFKLCVFVS